MQGIIALRPATTVGVTEQLKEKPMNATPKKITSRGVRWFSVILLGVAMVAPVFAGTGNLVKPDVLVVDHSLSKQALDTQILAARRYDTFWNTGDEAMARAALGPNFLDNTLPNGRPQGIEGVLKASKAFRTAVPDLRCDVRQMIVAGDRVVTHLHFTGHFTGSFMGKPGQGQAIDFIATDIYRVADGRIAEDWHLEDNLTFLQQAGLAAK
jgi:predicted ester cyclase